MPEKYKAFEYHFIDGGSVSIEYDGVIFRSDYFQCSQRNKEWFSRVTNNLNNILKIALDPRKITLTIKDNENGTKSVYADVIKTQKDFSGFSFDTEGNLFYFENNIKKQLQITPEIVQIYKKLKELANDT